MGYNVKYTDTTKTPITVGDGIELDTGLDISLFGRTKLEYGEELNENLLHLLENFSCPEDGSNIGNPDTSIAYSDLLEEPTEGQFWYNIGQERIFLWDGIKWQPMSNRGDLAANWGRLYHNETIPRPVGSTGYVYPYSECIWSVSPAHYLNTFDYMQCATDANAVVSMQYKLLNGTTIDGIVNYLIVGIRGNVNIGTQIAPTPPS